MFQLKQIGNASQIVFDDTIANRQLLVQKVLKNILILRERRRYTKAELIDFNPITFEKNINDHNFNAIEFKLLLHNGKKLDILYISNASLYFKSAQSLTLNQFEFYGVKKIFQLEKALTHPDAKLRQTAKQAFDSTDKTEIDIKQDYFITSLNTFIKFVAKQIKSLVPEAIPIYRGKRIKYLLFNHYLLSIYYQTTGTCWIVNEEKNLKIKLEAELPTLEAQTLIQNYLQQFLSFPSKAL